MEEQQKISIQKNKSWIGEKVKVLVDGVSAESDLLLQGLCENIKDQKSGWTGLYQ